VLQYQTEVDKLAKETGQTCPPADAVVREIEAWRWVFSPISAKCFAPVAVRNPPRLVKATDPQEKCSCWGLSMHVSEKQSVTAFHYLEENFDRIRKLIGTHLAVGKLSEAHGLATKPDKYGHFDLHPKKSAPFEKTFLVQPNAIPKLPDD